MIILLMCLITIISFAIFAFKRDRETFYIFMMCLSLAIFIITELIYIAKKGGISQQIESFYYLTIGIRLKLQYLLILLKNLGFLLAIGKFLFPLYLLLLATRYSAISLFKRNGWIKYTFYILPLLSILLYYPAIFKTYIEPYPTIQSYLVNFSYLWCVFYTLVALCILIFEVISIPMKFSRKYFTSIVIFIISLCVFYLLYVRQDPAQIYQFYYSTFQWKNGLHYITTILSLSEYWVLLILTYVVGIVGLVSLSRYTHDILEYSREQLIVNNEYESISTANTVFVHSIKNDLLANQVVLKRLKSVLENNEDLSEALKYQKMLESNQDAILSKVNEMYKSLKSNIIILEKTNLKEIIQKAINNATKHYPEISIGVELQKDINVLADCNHFAEAIYNLLINAIEASLAKEDSVAIQVKGYTNRLYTVIEVSDHGIGIHKKNLKKIFRPFTSSKNSKSNFGVGLTYVKTIVKEHNGRILVQSKVNEGTTFYILLPKYNAIERREKAWLTF